MNTTKQRLNDILASDGWRRSSDGEWISYSDGSDVYYICRYADALAAEEAKPADFETTRGWAFGDDGFEWTEIQCVKGNVTLMETTTATTALTSTPNLPGYDRIDQTIRTFSRYIRRECDLGMGICPEGSEARRVFQGPMVPGPWVDGSANAVCISAYHIESTSQVIIAKHGDLFTLQGRTWILTDDRPDRYPTLTLVTQ